MKENPNHKNLIKPYAHSFESLLQNPTRLKLEIQKKRKNVHYLINEKSLIEKLNTVGLRYQLKQLFVDPLGIEYFHP